MKFLIDAQLPRRFSDWLAGAGHDALHTLDAGYVGSHTCKALAQAGYTPISYDNLVYGHRHTVRWGPLEIGDLNDGARLDLTDILNTAWQWQLR